MLDAYEMQLIDSSIDAALISFMKKRNKENSGEFQYIVPICRPDC